MKVLTIIIVLLWSLLLINHCDSTQHKVAATERYLCRSPSGGNNLKSAAWKVEH